MPPDFTVAQANDLAHYFLGPDWTVELLPGGNRPCLLRLYAGGALDYAISYQGASWREVFRVAGARLPLRSQYVAQGVRVMLADRAICTAVSNTMAKRIAAALNNHIPDRRGI